LKIGGTVMPSKTIESLGFKFGPGVDKLFKEFQATISKYVSQQEALAFTKVYACRSCDVSLTRHYPEVKGALEVQGSDVMVARLSDTCSKDIWDCCKHKEYRKDDTSYVIVFSGDAERLRLIQIGKASELAKKTAEEITNSLRIFLEKQESKPPSVWFDYIKRKSEIWIESAKIYLGLLK